MGARRIDSRAYKDPYLLLGNYLLLIISGALAAGFAVCAAALARVRDVAGFFVAALVAGGASFILIAELLSLVSFWKPWPILLLQLIALIGIAVPARKHGDFSAIRRLRDLPRVFTFARARRNPVLVIVLGALSAVLSFELALAIGVAPNNWDSMTYHLTRIVYWMQNSSIMQYPLATERQAAFPVNAEVLQGWTMIFSRGDRLVQTVQWVAQLGIFAAVWALARDLGYSRRQAVLPLVAVAAMPVAMAQASTTQNDLIFAFLLAATLLFLLRAVRSERGAAILAGVAGGVAYGTKSSAPGFLAAVGIAGMISAGRQWRRLLLPVAALIVGMLALGSLNYGQNIIDRGGYTAAPSQDVFRIHSVKEIPSNLATMTWQSATHIPGGEKLKPVVWRLEHAWTKTVGVAAAKLSGNKNPGYIFNYDRIGDRAGLGLPFLLLILPALLWTLIRPRSREEWAVAASAVLAFLAVAVTLRNNPFTARFLMSSAVLAAPLAARFGGSRIMQALSMVLLLFTFATLGLHETYRSVLGPGPTVFAMERPVQITAVNPPELGLLTLVEQEVPEDARIGFVGMEDSYEYPLAGPHFDRTLVKLSPSDLVPGVFVRYNLDAIVISGAPKPAVPLGKYLYEDSTHLLIVKK